MIRCRLLIIIHGLKSIKWYRYWIIIVKVYGSTLNFMTVHHIIIVSIAVKAYTWITDHLCYDNIFIIIYLQFIRFFNRTSFRSNVLYSVRLIRDTHNIVRDHWLYLECILSQCNIKSSRPCSYFYTTRSHDIL